MHIIDLTLWQWGWLIIAAVLIGFSKTGIGGASMPVIPIIAGVFGGKESTGIMLPMLLIGDAFALYYYNRHGEWSNIRKLLPWAFVGLFMGTIVGNYVSDREFKAFIAVSVFICLL
ncbi:MAG: sulfite exporter TauE/SafE family protein, partial [Bacillota bacterium]|nr:sulfite exporter TauE/SafE family protein [Bacillota bacterium]